MLMKITNSLVCFTAACVVSACATNQDVAIRIEKNPSDFKLLIGEFDGSLALIHGSPKNAKIHATDGKFNCEGTSTTGKFETDFKVNKVTHLFDFVCDNEAAGQVILKITAHGNGNVYGVGTGVLSDGTKMKVIVGNLSGNLAW